MQPIVEALSSITLGAPAQLQNLTLFPLLTAEAREPDYVLLDGALAKKLARVTELSESGRVPELLLLKDADVEVLLVDGEQLIGANFSGNTIDLPIMASRVSRIKSSASNSYLREACKD